MLAKRLLQQGKPLGVVNGGIIGNRLLLASPRESDFGDALGEAGLARFERDALGAAGVSCDRSPGRERPRVSRCNRSEWHTGDGGIPDRGIPELIARSHERRIRIVGTTITPFEGTTVADGYFTAAKEAVRQK